MRFAFCSKRFGTAVTAAAAILTIALISGCNAQQDDESLDVTGEGNDANNIGGDDAGESNNADMNQGDMNQGDDMDGADINSETGNDTEISDVPMNATLNGAPANNPAAPPDMPAMPEPAPVNNVAAPAPTPAPAPVSPEQAPLPGGRVRYVPEGGVQVVNAPNGSPVTMLEQGDHPLTWEESGWLKLANGYFVPSGGLSDAGVGRPARGNAWQQ